MKVCLCISYVEIETSDDESIGLFIVVSFVIGGRGGKTALSRGAGPPVDAFRLETTRLFYPSPQNRTDVRGSHASKGGGISICTGGRSGGRVTRQFVGAI